MGTNTAKPKKSLNLRKAAAGRLILENPTRSLKSALVEVGYAESTSRIPAASGLSVDLCVAEAIKANPEIDPSALLTRSRVCFQKKLDAVIGDPEQLEQARLGEVARMLDVAETWYGGHQRHRTEVESFTDRLSFMASVLEEIKRRAPINNDRSPLPLGSEVGVLDAEVVEHEQTTPADVEASHG